MKHLILLLIPLVLAGCVAPKPLATTQSHPKSVTLSISADGRIYHHQYDTLNIIPEGQGGVLRSKTPIELEGVKKLAITCGAPEHPPKVIILCDPDVPFRHIKPLMDALANTGTWSISVAQDLSDPTKPIEPTGGNAP